MRFDPLPNGMRRGFTAAAGGKFEGPELSGEVMSHTGGDYPLFDEDDNAFFDARYILRTQDGTPIFMQARGMRVATPDINRRLRANEAVPMSEYFFRTSAFFEAPRGPYDWMNRTFFIGSGDRREDHGVFDYYAVR